MTNNLDLLAGRIAQPNRIKPTISDTSGALPPENSEIRKIADDVLNALKRSYSSVASQENLEKLEVGAESVESAFKEAILSLKPERQQKLRMKASELEKADVTSRKNLFGRFGEYDTQSFLSSGGMLRVHADLPALTIDKKLLGIQPPTISLLPSELRHTDGGLLLPSDTLPDHFEEADFEKMKTDLEEAKGIAEETGVYHLERLEDIWGPLYPEDPYGFEGEFEEDFEEQAITDKLSFNITRVKCLDETNPETIWFFGQRNWVHDDIDLGGVTTDEDGDTKKISPKKVGRGWDDGSQKRYSPHWRFSWFNMREEHRYAGAKWPKRYMVTLLLAEKDHGGFEKALQKVWESVRNRVKTAIENAVGGVLSAYLGPVIASAIGKAVAWLIDKFIGWLISLFGDDIFPAFVASCTVPSYSARWHYPNGTWGSPTSGIRKAHFRGHGGAYLIEYYWKLYS